MAQARKLYKVLNTSNTLLMAAGFLLLGFQLTGYFTS